MVSNDQSFEFELNPNTLREIEHFSDLICDQLFINETYYGNILMSWMKVLQSAHLLPTKRKSFNYI